MTDLSAYRHELKYQIGVAEYLILRQRLRALIHTDPHAGPDGQYRIISLYFDNYADKALLEKIHGVNRREKFRLRRYGTGFEVIHLEKKQKIDGLCLKTAASIDQAACRRLLAGQPDWLPPNPPELLQELDFQMRCQLLRPRTLVAYTREPYVYGPGNVRITFDFALATAQRPEAFLQPEAACIPTAGQQIIMEVKYDRFLPSFLADALQLGTPRVQAFSKYAACRGMIS